MRTRSLREKLMWKDNKCHEIYFATFSPTLDFRHFTIFHLASNRIACMRSAKRRRKTPFSKMHVPGKAFGVRKHFIIRNAFARVSMILEFVGKCSISILCAIYTHHVSPQNMQNTKCMRRRQPKQIRRGKCTMRKD